MNGTEQEEHGSYAQLDLKHEDPVVRASNRIILWGVRVVTVMMVIIIVWAISDVVFTFYTRVLSPPAFIMTLSDTLAVFGAVLTVLIAIEIYTNVTLYLTSNVIHVRLVVATALMAVARKVIATDYTHKEAEQVFAMAALGFSLGVVYWLIARKT